MTKALAVLADEQTEPCESPKSACSQGGLRSFFVHVSTVLRHYLQLVKPGIVFGNLVSVSGGFFLAARGHFDPFLFLATALGVSLVVASGCVFNNVIDRNIDEKMERTQKRVLVRHLVSPRAALVYGSLLGLAGFIFLFTATNLLSLLLAVGGFVIYVGAYSLYLKRRSVFGTEIGSLSGAMPPVIGYCAVTNHFDIGAALLLLMFSLWQMPHSYAIALVYLKDYAAAGIPVLPVKHGIAVAKKRLLCYIPAFALAAIMLGVCGYAGRFYLATTAAISLAWFIAAWSGSSASDDRIWARKMFLYSIIAVVALSVAMAVDYV